MMAEHTKEPWISCGEGECLCGMIWSEQSDQQIVTAYGGGDREFIIAGVHSKWGDAENAIYGEVSAEERAANSARIVSCVNALAGITDPSAVGELVKAAEAFVALYLDCDMRPEDECSLAYGAIYDALSRLKGE